MIEMTDELRDLLLYELGIYAEANASRDHRIDNEVLEELSKRYSLTKKQIQDLEDKMNRMYVRVIIDN